MGALAAPNLTATDEPGVIRGYWPDSRQVAAGVSSRAVDGELAYLTVEVVAGRQVREWRGVFSRAQLVEALRLVVATPPNDIVHTQYVRGTWPDLGLIDLQISDASSQHGHGAVYLGMDVVSSDRFSSVGHGLAVFARADLTSLLAAAGA